MTLPRSGRAGLAPAHAGGRHARGRRHRVAAAAARVGRAVLERGGNAVDAAVATASSRSASRGRSRAASAAAASWSTAGRPARSATLDFRETAPAADPRPTRSSAPGLHKHFTGHLTVGVPRHRRRDGRGAEPLRHAAAGETRSRPPSASRARASACRRRCRRRWRRNADAAAAVPGAPRSSCADGTAYRAGHDPAPARRSPRRCGMLMREGAGAFYGGAIARRIVADMQCAAAETRRRRAAHRPRPRGLPRQVARAAASAPTAAARSSRCRRRPRAASRSCRCSSILEGFDLGRRAGLGRRAPPVAEAQKHRAAPTAARTSPTRTSCACRPAR